MHHSAPESLPAKYPEENGPGMPGCCSESLNNLFSFGKGSDKCHENQPPNWGSVNVKDEELASKDCRKTALPSSGFRQERRHSSQTTGQENRNDRREVNPGLNSMTVFQKPQRQQMNSQLWAAKKFILPPCYSQQPRKGTNSIPPSFALSQIGTFLIARLTQHSVTIKLPLHTIPAFSFWKAQRHSCECAPIFLASTPHQQQSTVILGTPASSSVC